MKQVYVAVTEKGYVLSASSTPEKAKRSIQKKYGSFCVYKFKDAKDSGIEFIAYIKGWFKKSIVTVHSLNLDE